MATASHQPPREWHIIWASFQADDKSEHVGGKKVELSNQKAVKLIVCRQMLTKYDSDNILSKQTGRNGAQHWNL